MTFIMLVCSGAGRQSVRIKSNAAYTTHVAVFNVNHMPEGCGTWPAIWEVDEADWPDAVSIITIPSARKQKLMITSGGNRHR